jgi:serine/threonine protein kinase
LARDIQATVQQALGQRYAIERQLGRGGAAYVFLAREPGGRVVALKVLRPELLTGVAADRFLREIRLAGQLRHPLIAPVLDSGEAGWVVYFTMAYVEGPSLAQRLAQAGALPVDEVLRIARDVLTALEYAHGQGIIHRDVKPDNVILSPAGAVLLDFGIARAIETTAGEQLTRSGMTLGTSTYMSPEQITASRSLDPTTDLYALGCVLFECLAGRPPFAHPNEMVVLRQHLLEAAPDVRTLRPEVPATLADAIRRAMAKQPPDRWSSAAELRAALEA